MKQTTTVMSTYQIEVREMRTKTVPVIAETRAAAISRVKQAYCTGEIDLDEIYVNSGTIFSQV